MTLAVVLASAAQGDTVVDGAVITDFGGLAKNHAHAVVDEQAAADLGAGMDLDAGMVAAALADPSGQEKVLVFKQPVCDAMVYQDMKSRVQQYDFRQAAGGGVLVLDVACVLQ